MIALLAAFLAPAQACVDSATGPNATPVSAPQSVRNPAARVPIDLGTLGGLSVGRSSEAHAINSSGDIVGDGCTFLLPDPALWTRKSVQRGEAG